MSRPLFNKKTAELAGLLDSYTDSPDKLQILADELSHRSRPNAVKLRERVLAQLELLKKSEGVASTGTQGTLFEQSSLVELGAIDTEPRQAKSGFKDQFKPPSTVTLVKPRGVKNRPNQFRPTLQGNTLLDIEASSPKVKQFRIALHEHIRELRKNRIGQQQFALEQGRQVFGDIPGNSYCFDFDEEANIFQGAKVELLVGAQKVDGNLTNISNGQIVVTVKDDFGELIHSCILLLDNTALLQGLHDRLAKIEQGEASGFNTDFAESLLANQGAYQEKSTTLKSWPWEQTPTPKQRRFVEVALASNISWLWGPPGTGKTDTLSALIRILYDRGERVLICSNTNQAVDQVLMKLCSKLSQTDNAALGEGRVLRLGNIEDDLRKEFGGFVEHDKIVARLTAKLQRRREEIQVALEKLEQRIMHTESVLRKFKEFDQIKRAVEISLKQVATHQEQVKSGEAKVLVLTHQKSALNAELKEFRRSGFLKRWVLRDENTIRQAIKNNASDEIKANTKLKITQATLAEAEANHRDAQERLHITQKSLPDESQREAEQSLSSDKSEQKTLRKELSKIDGEIESVKDDVLKNARIVGATVTRTFLRSDDFAKFDSIILDEASMVLLPAVFQLAGLATKRFVVSGDFQQLPPIVQTRDEAIHDVIGHDIFCEAAITLENATETQRLVMLDEQFRMDDQICRLVSREFYNGMLVTHPQRNTPELDSPAPLNSRLIIVDTSRIWPFTTRDPFNSRFNLMHAIVARNIVLQFQANNLMLNTVDKGRVGVCTPYRAQAALIREVLRSNRISSTNVRASTAHGFQGDERDVILFDLVDSVGERYAGIFLQACGISESGARLTNVALSRAREQIVIIANLTFLDQRLPSRAILRGVLHDIQQAGQVIDADEILELFPVSRELERLTQQTQINPETLRTGLLGSDDFMRICPEEFEQAMESIVIFSAFITPNRVAELGDLFRRKVSCGVKIRCVTRPPNRNGSMAEIDGRNAISALQEIGVAVDLRNDIHEKVVLVDDAVVWFGSLNLLSHNSRTSELMGRIEDTGISNHLTAC